METGIIEASSKEAAAVLLQKYNIFVTSLQEEVEREPLLKKIKLQTSIPKKDLAIFSRQLAVMLDSRVPVTQSLISLAAQSNRDDFKKVIINVSNLVQEGVSLSEALSRFPQVFNNFYVNLIKSGEASGKMTETLYYIADHLERERDITTQLQQAMVYPIFTLSILFVVLNIIIVFLLPKIEELIRESDVNPPLFTVIMLHFYAFLENSWWIMMAGLVFLIITFIVYFKTPEGKKSYDSLLLKIPFLGNILRKVFLARFCGNISTLISSGVSITTALNISSDTINNSVYKNIISEVEHRVSEGEKISSVLVEHQDYFPPFVIQMIKVGEETGKLDSTLLEIVNFYQKEIKGAIDLFLTLLEPTLIIFLGIIVGILAISVFAPLYSSLGTV